MNFRSFANCWVTRRFVGEFSGLKIVPLFFVFLPGVSRACGTIFNPENSPTNRRVTQQFAKDRQFTFSTLFFFIASWFFNQSPRAIWFRPSQNAFTLKFAHFEKPRCGKNLSDFSFLPFGGKNTRTSFFEIGKFLALGRFGFPVHPRVFSRVLRASLAKGKNGCRNPRARTFERPRPSANRHVC